MVRVGEVIGAAAKELGMIVGTALLHRAISWDASCSSVLDVCGMGGTACASIYYLPYYFLWVYTAYCCPFFSRCLTFHWDCGSLALVLV